ncbi:Acetyltransferase (GNAT) family protein [Desulfatibacillum alkenivorans DSM 16219]|uniref:Acetyltransferase (GNAT) family protein n=1 Tax=Desulfatibacillum alkenivorans DSM 16219 TaxID=1121393 RepID=A0A1M6SCH9_9BACT|nr:GNAT family N-acetyltransferase [Desulfatibacillum alkenivorans]SHK42376.1 Acetyltransferase (GNAT) family protein [Desulfatibacillum alkenivorans DSM 16219]
MKSQKQDICVCVGLPEEYRKHVAETYVRTFPHKFETIMGGAEKARQVLEKDLNRDCAIVASWDGDFAGVAGINFLGARLVKTRKRTFVRTFGLLTGLLRFGAFRAVSGKASDKELLFDGLVVEEKMRGKGVGSRLLQGVVDYARDRGFSVIKLDVLDTNPRAKALYERSGFKAVKTVSYPYLYSLGFSGVTTMALSL